MSIASAIHWKLSNAAAVTAIVGTEIFSIASPNNIYPVLVYSYVDATENLLTGPPVTQLAMVSVVAVAKDYETAHSLADAAKVAMNRQKGSWNGINVQGCYHQPDQTEEDSAQDSAQLRFYMITQTFKLLTY